MRVALLFALIAIPLATPVQASQVPLADVAQLSARGEHACVVTTGGGVKCWGSNSRGQLGAGPTGVTRSAASDVTGLASGAVFVAASTGAHSCAIVAGGGIKCWGANDQGQLGDGTVTDRTTPVDVVGLPWAAIAIAAGESHTCALSVAGAVACWGSNVFGQVGDGTTTQRQAPTPVSGLSGGVVAISTAVNHSCVATSAGGVKCWGANHSGQLGDGTTTQRSAPVDVNGIAGATAVATGGWPGAPGPNFFAQGGRSCAVIGGGAARCWAVGGVYDPGPQAAPPIEANAISQGGGQIFILKASYLVVDVGCAVSPGGGARCWGSDFCGMLGSNPLPSCSPMGNYPTNGPITYVSGLSTGVAAVSVARTFACALLSTGAVKCWGFGYAGTPVVVMAGTSPQVIQFSSQAAPPVAVGGTGTLNLISFGGSGNPVVFSSLTPTVCFISGSTQNSVTVTGAGGGLCTIAANQAGNEYFDAAVQSTYGLTIDPRIAQTISLAVTSRILGTPWVAAVPANGVGTVIATSSSGLPVALSVGNPGTSSCTISGNVIRGLPTGDLCIVNAEQPGDATYAPANQVGTVVQILTNSGTFGLVVNKSGGGSGTVFSAPPGVFCGQECTGNFAASSTVSLGMGVAAAGSNFEGWGGSCTGTGSCILTMDGPKEVLAIFDADVSRLANVSTRALGLFDNDSLIAGFIIGGTGYKTVVVRVRGPSLAQAGIANPMPDPAVTIYRGQQGLVHTWGAGPDASTIQGLGFPPLHPLDTTVLLRLAPGAYSAIVIPRSANGTGVGIVEVFEVDQAAAAPLLNISTRARVGVGDNVLIGGFIIQGDAPQQVVVRARGPSLAPLGVSDTLADPQLELFSGNTSIGSNDNWQDAANAAALQALGFAPADARESAMLVTLPPGAYSAIVRGAGGSTGVGIVEVFKAN